MDLYKRVRTRDVLRRAWAKVRESGLASSSDTTVKETRRFDARAPANIDKIYRQLQAGTFEFRGDKGITPPKGKGKDGVRPIVLSPIPNRVVRRAILDVLQGHGLNEEGEPRRGWQGVPAIREIMATPTSIGGIAERGVPHGLAIIDAAVRRGEHFFVRSDIQNFFTCIPVADVNAFVAQGVDSDRFATLFSRALVTNLDNAAELEERHRLVLFPNDSVGVAQGSALSALAGNIALRSFDAQMNGKGITCVRYIDDFIILGSKEAHVRAAYKSARTLLSRLDMDVYDLGDSAAVSSGKVDAGSLYDGTDFLGYRISGLSLQPCAAARRSLLDKLDKLAQESIAAMRAAASGDLSKWKMTHHSAMVELNKIVWGWSQSFKYTTARHVFAQLDDEIALRIRAIETEAERLRHRADPRMIRRLSGVHCLADTPHANLPANSIKEAVIQQMGAPMNVPAVIGPLPSVENTVRPSLQKRTPRLRSKPPVNAATSA